MSAFTPGPWRVKIDNVFAGPIGDAIHIADCEPMGGPFDGTPAGRANARLIAAAPDLLAALEFVASDPRFRLLGLVTHDEVADAIEKATGKWRNVA